MDFNKFVSDNKLTNIKVSSRLDYKVFYICKNIKQQTVRICEDFINDKITMRIDWLV